jgi:WD40 repeat protein/energy-coupling factor transporter ATP-binding protein EcfA2
LKEIESEILAKKQTSYSVKFNPFPGLRPFTVKESHLYFGRENQVDEIVEKLNDNRFVAILGASGSGKSSLMYCGLIPTLEGGTIGGNNKRWRLIKSRPGETPIENLAKAINLSSSNFSSQQEIEKNITESTIYATLRSNSLGLIDALQYLSINENENILLLIDQFEELFRFQNIKSHEHKDQALEFVQLLLNLVNARQMPAYVVFTMRSDFVSECAQFPELAELINRSNYLVPQMTRNELKRAIEGPIAVANGKINTNLVNLLINDVGDNPDQLPILQHALMRSWDYWEKHREGEEELDINHYLAVGSMERALSDHANEAFAELDSNGEQICEIMFKLLTEKQSEDRGIRRPVAVSEIMEVSLAGFAEVVLVIDKFRKTGRAFLNSPTGNTITTESIIDISHESLMRIWDRLKVWVDEEAISAQMYLRLVEASENYFNGSGNLWLPPDLHLAINWRNKQYPTKDWALRYAQPFERAISFLDTSEREFNAAELNKIRQQKKALRRSKITAIVLGIAAIISLGFMLYAITAQVEAEKQRKMADQQRVFAQENEQKAVESAEVANEKTKEAEKQKQIAEQERRKAEVERQRAFDLFQLANDQKEIAFQKTKEAEYQKSIADSNARIAFTQKNLAESEKEKALRLRLLSIAQSMAIKSQQIDRDSSLAQLLAFQAFTYNTDYHGEDHNNDIYNALYKVYYADKPISYFDVRTHSEAVRGIAVSSKTGEIFTAGSDGVISKISAYKNVAEYKNIYEKSLIIKSIEISNDGKYLAALTDDNYLLFFDLTSSNARQQFNTRLKGNLIMRFDDYSNSLLIAGEQKIMSINVRNIGRFNTSKLPVLAQFTEEVTSFDKLEKLLIVTTKSGIVYSMIPDEGSAKTVISELNTVVTKTLINKVDKTVAMGDINGGLYIYDLNTNQLLYRLNAHRARISDIKFSKNFAYLATASFDGSVLVWKTKNYDIQPLVLKDAAEWIWSIAFSNDMQYLYAGYTNGKTHRWPLNTLDMANELKTNMKRDFTTKEWNRYIGEDIRKENIK